MTYQINFDDFTDNCLDELTPRQEAFMSFYDIESYENWHYDHGIGIFEFKSKNGKYLYFRYVDIGSYSTKTNTWKWAWDNSSTPHIVKRPLNKVKQFGETHSFENLTTGLIDGDEYTGWAMTAIAAKLLSAIGAYRIPEEHLFVYFVFTRELNEDEYAELKEDYISCDTHGTGRITFVCSHLLTGKDIGFNEPFESDPSFEHTDNYQAWCNECEKVRIKEHGWSDKAIAFTQTKLVCEDCYFVLKERNQ